MLRADDVAVQHVRERTDQFLPGFYFRLLPRGRMWHGPYRDRDEAERAARDLREVRRRKREREERRRSAGDLAMDVGCTLEEARERVDRAAEAMERGE